MRKPDHYRAELDQLYATLNRRDYVSPDPLQFLYDYPRLADREIVGLIAASLAFGGVRQICASISAVLARLEQLPYDTLMASNRSTLRRSFRSFKHRWVDGETMAAFLWAIARTVRERGSLEAAATAGADDMKGIPRAHAALVSLVRTLCACGDMPPGPLLSDPTAGSACKRLHLFLRWMIRQDAVDPGGWTILTPADLCIPLDTHMFRLAHAMKMTRRRQANGRTAEEITRAFCRINPDDPVRYDFALTRLGIRPELSDADFLRKLQPGRKRGAKGDARSRPTRYRTL